MVTTPLLATVPAGTGELIMELFSPVGTVFSVGANTAPETGPSYWSCENDTPQVITSHLVFNMQGTCTAPSPTPTATTSPTPTATATVTATPPTLIVTTTADSGPGSLRQALADVHDGDTIHFDPALNGQTITLTTGELRDR